MQTNPRSRVQADCVLTVRCCQRWPTNERHHGVFAKTEQDWCPRWNNSVYQGNTILLTLEIYLLLLVKSSPAASASLIFFFINSLFLPSFNRTEPLSYFLSFSVLYCYTHTIFTIYPVWGLYLLKKKKYTQASVCTLSASRNCTWGKFPQVCSGGRL